jgi:hypothetical protein
LNKSEKNRWPCLVPNLCRKHWKCGISCHLRVPFVRLRKFPSIFRLLKFFKSWIGIGFYQNAFSASVEVVIWFFAFIFWSGIIH